MKIQIVHSALHSLCCLAIGILPCLTGCDSQKQTAAPTVPSVRQAGIDAQVPAANVENGPGLEHFSNETKPLLAWIEARRTPAKIGQVSPAAEMAEFVSMVKAVNTDGLPVDLKDAWQRFVTLMTEVDGVFKSLPVGEPTSPQAPASAMAGIQPKLQELAAMVTPAVKELAEIGRKHNIPDLEKLGPSEPAPAIGGSPPPPSPIQPSQKVDSGRDAPATQPVPAVR